MPEEKPTDAIEKFLLEQKAVEDRKQALIEDLLRQRAEAIKAFDEKLAKLGHKTIPMAPITANACFKSLI
jgi:hypothetical protein